MKHYFGLFFLVFLFISCSKTEVEVPSVEEKTASESTLDTQIELSGNEMTLWAEEELSRDLNNLLNDVSNEQE